MRGPASCVLRPRDIKTGRKALRPCVLRVICHGERHKKKYHGTRTVAMVSVLFVCDIGDRAIPTCSAWSAFSVLCGGWA